MDDGRVTLNAGGRVFETTALNAENERRGLLRGAAWRDWRQAAGQQEARARLGRRRRRAGPPRDIHRSRSGRVCRRAALHAVEIACRRAVAADVHRLADLKTEAEFLAYDALFNACDAAEAAAAAAAALAAPVPRDCRRARCFTSTDENTDENGWGEEVRISVPKGQVLSLHQVLPTGQ